MCARIHPVTLESSEHKNLRIGQAKDFLLSKDQDLCCTVEADDESWSVYQKASLDDGCNLFVGDFPIIGPAEM
jgi:hypothetical protein